MKNQCGRSMIEMLGVLAIIAILSVGGIAGYSKAMEKWKVNKSVEQYNYMIIGLLEHLDEFKNRSSSICSVWGIRDWSYCGLKSYLRAAHLVPDDWQDSVDNLLVDSNGNVISVFSRGGRLVIDMHIGGFAILQDGTGKTPHFPVDMCRHILKDVAKPLQDVIQFVWVYKSGKNNPKFYGKYYCSKNSKCLRDITLNEINAECSGCTTGTRSCSVTFEF